MKVAKNRNSPHARGWPEMRSTEKLIVFLLVMLATLAAPRTTHAGPKEEARKHYDRAVELVDDGQLAEAIVEFQRAYDLTKHFSVLYNIGQVFVSLVKPVEAISAYEGYLAGGGQSIPAARRAEVEREIARQKSRLATVDIRVLPEGAAVRPQAEEALRKETEDYIIGEIKAGGAGSRFRIDTIQPSDDPASKFTVRQGPIPGTLKFETERKGDTLFFGVGRGGPRPPELPGGDGSVMRFNGPVVFRGVTFAGDAEKPLVFVALRGPGLVYVKGKGSVTTPDGATVTFPPSGSTVAPRGRPSASSRPATKAGKSPRTKQK